MQGLLIDAPGSLAQNFLGPAFPVLTGAPGLQEQEGRDGKQQSEINQIQDETHEGESFPGPTGPEDHAPATLNPSPAT